MAVKLRLQRKGRKKAPFYHIVAADARSPRDGKYIERLGSYNPLTRPATIELDNSASLAWLQKGAEPTDTVRAILRYKGVYFHKHLNRGVAKGVITQEVADAKLVEWLEKKEDRVAQSKHKTEQEKEAFRKLVDGEKKVKIKPVVEVAPPEETQAAEMPAAVAAPEVVEAGAEAPATIFETIAETASDVADAVAEKVGDAVEAVSETAAEVADTVAEKASEAVEAARETAAEVADTVAEKASEAVEAARETAAEVADTVAEKASEAVEAARETAAEVADAVAEKASDVFEAVTETGGEMVEAATDAVENVGEAVVDAVTPDEKAA